MTVNFKLQTSNNIKKKRKLFISVIVSTQGIESSIPSRDIYHICLVFKNNEHINDVCNKASQRVGVIMRLRNLIPTTAKLVLFKSGIVLLQ